MKSLNTNNLNFRKLVKLYIIFTIIAICLSCALLGYVYKNKLIFAYHYNQVTDKIEYGNIGVDEVKTDITKLAKQSADIIDILILDDNNKITYSAKNSEFVKDGEFSLEQKNHGGNRYFTYLNDTNITINLIKEDEFVLFSVLLANDNNIQKDYRDNSFYEKNISMKKIYLLSYAIDKTTGNKIYFISDIHPIKNGQLYLEIVCAILILCFMLYWVLVAFWVYMDARKSKINNLLWGGITLLSNIAGLFIYLIYKQNNQICSNCGTLQSKGNIHCIHCGTKINKTCVSCHALINTGDHYCRNCGSEIK